jgi:hypothetical protein
MSVLETLPSGPVNAAKTSIGTLVVPESATALIRDLAKGLRFAFGKIPDRARRGALPG